MSRLSDTPLCAMRSGMDCPNTEYARNMHATMTSGKPIARRVASNSSTIPMPPRIASNGKLN